MPKPGKAFAAVVLTTALFTVAGPAPASAAKAAKHRASHARATHHGAHSAHRTSGKGKKKSAPASAVTASAAAALAPAQFVDKRVQKVLTDLKSQPLRAPGLMNLTEVSTAASKGAFLSSLYEKNAIETSWATEMLADKLIFARVLEKELGSRALIYYPKTMGLREFLVKHRLVKADGALTPDGDRIESALHEEFPAGFVVRPAVGVAPQETGRGMFQDGDQFIVELLKPNSPLYEPEHLKQPVISHILGTVASGEAIVIQENIVGSADARKPLKSRFYQEVRVHSYESRVVEGSVPERWVQTSTLNDEQAKQAEAFVADFLKSLPLNLVNKQAWGIDVGVLDNGEMRVVDVVTNRGKKIAWSSYLDQPRVLGAYARHFETYYGLRFSGMSGSLLRNNFGNYFPFWNKRIEKARPGLGKVMAYLPPVP